MYGKTKSSSVKAEKKSQRDALNASSKGSYTDQKKKKKKVKGVTKLQEEKSTRLVVSWSVEHDTFE